ncbi:hypothetical protein [Geothrix sp. PMB-07]|uniref:hypothetical protein n=1 Tax=Geothrix sp. PMB-07 TaxID=3068640 RepID=UPI0027406712|nr:hypothetical protein [Geothrix sp. PMB-07]WLT30362.1 hypothetical protein Q9293_11595 [Geothrix sp. PMB-07]
MPLQAPPATTPPSIITPAQAAVPVRAQYGWGYAGPDGEGVGTLSLLLEAATGRLVLELHAPGERLMLLEGDKASGYRLQVPRQKVDQRAASLAQLPLPFLPQVQSVEGLLRLLRTGEGAGLSVQKKDAQGPLKLHWRGKDARGKDEQVWLDRKRWDEAK